MKLTKNALDALNAAGPCARQLGHDHIGAEHILLSILAVPKSQAAQRLVRLGLSLEELAESMRTMIASSSQGLMVKGELPVSSRAKKIVDMAAIAAGKDGVVGTVHLVEAMLREGENAAAQLLFNAGVTVKSFLAAGTQGTNDAKGNESRAAAGQEEGDAGTDAAADDDDDGDDDEDGDEDDDGEGENASGANKSPRTKEAKTPTVNAFGRDLTDLARQGKLDPVIGRDKEIKRVIQILSRRTKNNAVLIGEAGVGKTAVAEGLAQAIHSGSVPEKMQSKRVVALDMARIVAGTQYRGQFEERLKRITDETKRAGNIILFLDEIHTLVGAGGAEGAMDAANILKPALARGELQCVGATTLKEYHKSIERDAALERRFQSVIIEEPSIADTVEILKGIAAKYEEHHSVKFPPAALQAAVELTARYLPSRQLPDKAIDAMDETGARLRMGASERPRSLTSIQESINALRAKKDEAVKNGDFDTAAAFRDAIHDKSAAFEKALKTWKAKNAEKTLVVSPAHIAETVSSMSGVPVERMNAATAEKLLGMEKALGKVVIGQDAAVSAIARSLRRSKTLLADPNRPIGSFLFLGPTGTGKTHLAKMLANHVYGDDKALIVLDMSEYQEKYSSSRLVGAPPGYVGYDEGGQLTEKVRRRPYSVILFDEFEKANADVCNMLLQILDDGRLTDGQGRTIDFRNTVVICTANLGFDFANEGRALGFSTRNAETSYDILKEKLLAESKRTFRPELLNRFDETVVFRKLEKADMAAILKLELERLGERLAKAGIALSIDSKAEDFLVGKGLDPALGARPLRRVVQDYIEDPLSEMLLAGKAASKLVATLAEDSTRLAFNGA